LRGAIGPSEKKLEGGDKKRGGRLEGKGKAVGESLGAGGREFFILLILCQPGDWERAAL